MANENSVNSGFYYLNQSKGGSLPARLKQIGFTKFLGIILLATVISISLPGEKNAATGMADKDGLMVIEEEVLAVEHSTLPREFVGFGEATAVPTSKYDTSINWNNIYPQRVSQ